MAICEQAKSGGIATEDMANLADVVITGLLKGLMPAMQSYYAQLFQEREAHKQTLRMFQAVVDGEFSRDAIVVNADGWQMMKERPAPEGVPMEPALNLRANDGVLAHVDGTVNALKNLETAS